MIPIVIAYHVCQSQTVSSKYYTYPCNCWIYSHWLTDREKHIENLGRKTDRGYRQKRKRRSQRALSWRILNLVGFFILLLGEGLRPLRPEGFRDPQWVPKQYQGSQYCWYRREEREGAWRKPSCSRILRGLEIMKEYP